MDKLTAFLTVIGSAGFVSLAGCFKYLVERHDKKHDELKAIKSMLVKSEKDNVRTQMLLMISDYPDNVSEIMRLAEHYFKDLKGNWYMTSLFNNWLNNNEIAKPEWFDSEK